MQICCYASIFNFVDYVMILLQTLQMNLHYALERASKLTEEGIEINPGPEYSNRNYKIKKAVQASHYQGNSKYGEPAGMQCNCNAYFAIIFSVINSIDIWKALDLDYILEYETTDLSKLVCISH